MILLHGVESIYPSFMAPFRRLEFQKTPKFKKKNRAPPWFSDYLNVIKNAWLLTSTRSEFFMA